MGKQNRQRGAGNLAGVAVLGALLVVAGILMWMLSNRKAVSEIPADPMEQPLKKPAAKQVSLYFDRSKSMQGFVKNPVSGSAYRRFVEDAETVLTTGVAQDLDVSGFGKKVAPVGDRFQYRRIDFYNEDNTRIDAAVNAAKASGKLSIIVTDLFQDQHEVSTLITPLRDYLNDTDAIGIIGAVSPFEGNIEWDNDKFFPHKGTLPFYALVLGPAQEVAHTLKVLEERIFGGSTFCPGENCDVMSVFISKRSARLLAKGDESGKRVDVVPKSAKEFQEVTLVPQWIDDARVQQLELLAPKGVVGGKFMLTTPVFWTHARALSPATQLPPAVVSAFQAQKNGAAGKGGFPPAGWNSMPKAAASLEVGTCRLGADSKQVSCPVTIVSKLPTNDNYLFRIDIPLGTSRGIDLEPWSFNEALAARYSSKKKPGFDSERGSTRNLKMLLSGLLEVASSDPPPLAARAYLVVRSK